MSAHAQPFPDPCRITWIEDNPADVRLFTLACEEHGLKVELNVLTDGESAVNYVQSLTRNALDVLIVDINLPRIAGHSVIAVARTNPHLVSTPIVVLTTSKSPKDRDTAERLGATTVAYKPNDYDEFAALVKDVVLKYCPTAECR
jgi:CheY-like chemotaxis protein